MGITKYWLDRADQIIAVNDVWSEFAIENTSPHLLPAHVIGKCLWSFLDLNTQLLYQMLFRHVRATNKPTTLSLRCDSLTIRRPMTMVITPGEDQALFIACDIQSTSLIRYSIEPPMRMSGLLRICSWCNRVAVSDGEWVEIEVAMPRLGAFENYPIPNISHGICPSCLAMVEKELDPYAVGENGTVLS